MPVTSKTDRPRRIVISLGGLALGDGLDCQRSRIREVAPLLLEAIDTNAEVIITHGNGSQVNMVQRAFGVAAPDDKDIPVIDLPECGAMTQSYIGYHLQQAIGAEMHKREKKWHVATVITQIEVEPDDPSLANPTKQIGPHLTKAQADAQSAQHPDFRFVDDGRGFRRVVASPRPRRIVESESILNLLDNDFIVIACGGGGIPVIRDSDDKGCYVGIPAVIEKDYAAELLGDDCNADELVFLTDVDNVCTGFGGEDERPLGDVTVPEIHALLDAGEFGKDTMAPKVRAALRFCENRPARVAIIGSLDNAPEVVRGISGTRIHY